MKRTNVRSSFAFTLLLALILPILAACGGGATTPPAAGGATTAPAAAAPTAAPAAGAAATTAPAPAQPTAAAAEPTTAAPVAEGGKGQPGVLRVRTAGEPENLDPQQSSFVDEIQFIMLNYLPLMTFDTNMKPIPGAAESVDLSPDGKTYTFHIRPNSKYSDGSPLTAKNFEFAWKRLADPVLAGQYQSIGCGIIKGYSEYAATSCPDKDGNTKTITEVQALDLKALRDQMGVKATDDNTLTIELTNPAPYFLAMAAIWIGAPVREEDAAEADALAKGDPAHYIGNGPFILKDHQPDVGATWVANPNWPLGPTKIQEIDFKIIKESQVAFQAYKNGELDYYAVAAEDLDAAKSDPELSKQIVDLGGQCNFYLGFNLKKAPFDNQKVRQAFAQAIDRDAYVRDVLKGLGKPAQSFIPPGFPGNDPDEKSWPFDAAGAKKTLADAGFADVSKLPPIKLTYNATARNKVRFEWIANQLKQNLGIDAALDPVDSTAYAGIQKTDPPQLFFLGWCADYPDQQDWTSLVFKTGGVAAARVEYSSKQLDDLVSKADVETDPKKRDDLYLQAQKILVQDAPVAFVYYDNNVALVKPYVKNYKITPIDYIVGFFSLKDMEVSP